MFPAASLSYYSSIMVPSASTVAKKDSSAQQSFVAKQLITNQHQVITKIALVIKNLYEITFSGWHKQNGHHESKIPKIHCVYQPLQRSQSHKQKNGKIYLK